MGRRNTGESGQKVGQNVSRLSPVTALVCTGDVLRDVFHVVDRDGSTLLEPLIDFQRPVLLSPAALIGIWIIASRLVVPVRQPPPRRVDRNPDRFVLARRFGAAVARKWQSRIEARGK